MPYKDPKAARANKAKHYKENPEDYKARARAWTMRQRDLLREIIQEAKNRPCEDCGKTFPVVCMDFDHAGADKEGNISNMVQRGMSVERLLAEIAKCEVVCSNCHRIRTEAERRRGME